jgi:arsenite methyltransferase
MFGAGMAQMAFDERAAARLEKLYATRDVLRRRRLVREAVAAAPGERVLDVGCGPGFYVRELLDEVTPGGSVVGVDASPDMLAVAARRCEGHGDVELRHGEATELPVARADFDAALSVQVLEYVPDATAALAEIHRALRPGGRVVVWDVDWSTVSWHSADAGRMARVLEAWDEHLAHPALPRTLAARLRAAGFDGVEMEGHVFATTELTTDAYGGAMIPLIAAFVRGRGGITDADAGAWADEQRDLHERGEFYFACLQCCFRAVRRA